LSENPTTDPGEAAERNATHVSDFFSLPNDQMVEGGRFRSTATGQPVRSAVMAAASSNFAATPNIRSLQ
jgi:hypothetical protein